MHRRERLHSEQFRDGHTARCRNAADIVTQQIDNHQVLGPIFFCDREFCGLPCIFLRIGHPRAGPFNRPGFNLTAGDFKKAFRGEAQQTAFVKTNKCAERRPVLVTQMFPGLPLTSFITGAEPLCQIYLVTVAGTDILFDPLETPGVALSR